jgi:hypothetical protein
MTPKSNCCIERRLPGGNKVTAEKGFTVMGDGLTVGWWFVQPISLYARKFCKMAKIDVEVDSRLFTFFGWLQHAEAAGNWE